MTRAGDLIEHFASGLSPPGARSRGPRSLLVVAHPDDETIGAGGMLAAIDPLGVLIVTDGAPRNPWFAQAAGAPDRQAYAELRWRELESALTSGGVPPERAVGYGFVDQEAALELEALTHQVHAAFERHHPDAVLTHPYEGGHPDHDATAFAVHSAALQLTPARRPVILELAYYNEGNGGPVWGRFASGDAGREIGLCAGALARKRAMFACYPSQAQVLAHFPLGAERLRAAPEYDFRAPPPAPRIHYDGFGWPITSSEFVRRARAARLRI